MIVAFAPTSKPFAKLPLLKLLAIKSAGMAGPEEKPPVISVNWLVTTAPKRSETGSGAKPSQWTVAFAPAAKPPPSNTAGLGIQVKLVAVDTTEKAASADASQIKDFKQALLNAFSF